jgi:hypothetical protein
MGKRVSIEMRRGGRSLEQAYIIDMGEGKGG